MDCRAELATATPSAPTATVEPTMTAVPTATPIPGERQEATVVRVVDGDTIVVGGRHNAVRVTGDVFNEFGFDIVQDDIKTCARRHLGNPIGPGRDSPNTTSWSSARPSVGTASSSTSRTGVTSPILSSHPTTYPTRRRRSVRAPSRDSSGRGPRSPPCPTDEHRPGHDGPQFTNPLVPASAATRR